MHFALFQVDNHAHERTRSCLHPHNQSPWGHGRCVLHEEAGYIVCLSYKQSDDLTETVSSFVNPVGQKNLQFIENSSGPEKLAIY